MNVIKPHEIKIIGLGGAGCRALRGLVGEGAESMDLIALDTDRQSLEENPLQRYLLLGPHVCHGLGTGGRDDRFDLAFLESEKGIRVLLQGAKVVIVVAGLSGGAGQRGAVQLANLAKKQGALTFAFVFTPFRWEGPGRLRRAQNGLAAVQDAADRVIAINPEGFLKFLDSRLSVSTAFEFFDLVLVQELKALLSSFRIVIR